MTGTKEQSHYVPLAARLRRLLIICTVGAVLAMSAITIAIHLLTFSRQISDDMSHAVNSSAKLIRFYLYKQHELITRMVRSCPEGSREEILAYIENKIPILDKGDSYLVLTPDRKVAACSSEYSDELKGLDLSRMNFLKLNSQVSPVQQSLFSSDPVVIFKYYLPDNMLLLVERDIKNLIPIIKSTTPKIENVVIFVLSNRGTVVYHPEEEFISSRKNLRVEFQDWQGPDRYGLYHFILDGTTYWCSTKELDLPEGWTFYAAISKGALISSAARHLMPILSTMLLVFVGMLLLFNLTIIRHLSRPVQAVAKHLEQVTPLERPVKFPKELAAGTFELKLILDQIEYLLSQVFAATQKIKVREELLSIVTEFGTDWAYWIDRNGKFLYVSGACQEITGYSPEEFMEQPGLLTSIILPEDRGVFEEHMEHSLGEIPHEPLEFRIITKDAKVKWIRHVCRKITDSGGNFLGVRGSNVDITRAKNAEILLAQERHRLITILDTMEDGLLALDRENRILFRNRAAQAILGLGDEMERDSRLGTEVIPANFSKQDLEEILELIATASTAERSWSLKRLLDIEISGRLRKIQVLASPVLSGKEEGTAAGKSEGVVLVLRDKTDELRRQSEQFKLEKLQNLGLAAGGIAHDFNNLLTAILGNINLLRYQLGEDHPASGKLKAAEKACLRAQNLTQQLLTFAKGGEPIKKATSIPDLIKETAEFVLTGKATACNFDFPDDLWLTDVDPGQVSQMIQNLAINAVQAMKGRGTISIRAENVIMEQDSSGDSASEAGLAPGRYVKIEIEDEGPGILDEMLDKIFDPYFTTKAGGSGLGLSVCLSIAARHGGTILVDSRPGEGTCFTIFLPAADSRQDDRQTEEVRTGINQADGPPDSSLEQAETAAGRKILIMDDESSILELVSEGLKAMGYRVDTAAKGEDALKLYRRSLDEGKKYHAVILDLTIAGGLGGVETAKRILEMDPHAVLIVSTGYSDELVMKRPEELGFRASLPKPYRLSQLKEVLDRLLQA